MYNDEILVALYQFPTVFYIGQEEPHSTRANCLLDNKCYNRVVHIYVFGNLLLRPRHRYGDLYLIPRPRYFVFS